MVHWLKGVNPGAVGPPRGFSYRRLVCRSTQFTLPSVLGVTGHMGSKGQGPPDPV